MLYSKQLLEENFAQLNILEAEEMLFELNEGEHHAGVAEVVRVLAGR
ncbi:MAG: hypothetical protein IT270_16515 [Saprospiraceae bacterium]|nr:hypothetical protein [Saprospiraceae bacterium]